MKKSLRMLLLVVACVGGVFLLIDANTHPSSTTLGEGFKLIFTLIALGFGGAVWCTWLMFEKPAEFFILPFVFLGFCLVAWIASYHVGTSSDYPVVVIEKRNGEIQIMDERGRFISPFTGKIVVFPKVIEMKIRIKKDGLTKEWPLLVTLTMEADVGTLEKKIEFLRQYENLSHLSQWRRAIEEKVKEEICANNSKQIEEILHFSGMVLGYQITKIQVLGSVYVYMRQ